MRMLPSYRTALCLGAWGIVAAIGACNGNGDADPNALLDTDSGGASGSSSGGPVVVPECVEAAGGDTSATRSLSDETGTATVFVEGSGCKRIFQLSSTAERRDNLPEGARSLREEGRPSLHTKNDLFDALYQLALEEARENSVAAIKDHAFNSGAEITCPEGGCFETGRKWNYVWTRDTAYAADLGLGWIDAPRARASLEFKLSLRRDGSDVQIVQDTGTGGSYPVSTDRAVWALGAREVLLHLAAKERSEFAERVYPALVNTIAHDRAVIYDPADGLYRGEQSFLDWRDQSYPAWVMDDLASLASSKSLSTNVAHLALLDLAGELAAERGEAAATADFTAKASALRTAIRTRLWVEEENQIATYTTTELDPSPARRFDLLGTSLAVLHDVTTPEQSKLAIGRYPMLPKGPPVIFPQQKEIAIYHNRAIWPFVTAYGVRAARKVGNDGAFDAGVRSLVRGAALNLSNMENLEVVTGKAFHADGIYSGPVVNSQRQLWSVAGYVGMVNGAIFGLEAERSGLRVAPFVTRGLRRALFGAAETIALNDVPFRGKKVSVVVRFPADPELTAGGAYAITRVRLNGAETPHGILPETELADRNLVEVELATPSAPAAKAREIFAVNEYRWIFAPRTPEITSLDNVGGKLQFGIDTKGEAGAEITLRVYRDGVAISGALPGGATSFRDESSTGETSPSHCYTVEATYVLSGNTSQRAKPRCFWGTGTPRITTVSAGAFTNIGGVGANQYGRFFYAEWGDEGHSLEATFTATRSGEHFVQLGYGNGAGGITTGITCAVKHVIVTPSAGGSAVGDGYILMPQRGDWASWGNSTFVRANLTAGTPYRVRIEHDRKAVNMSAFAHFGGYTGGTGGAAGAFFRANVAEIKILARGP